MRAPSRRLSARLVQALLASTALVGAGPALAQSALPTGGHVVSGGVSIGRPTNGALAITQSSQTAIVNWQGFSIGQANRVDIAQPNASAAILNRVTGTTPSTIAGQLTANGQVYLVNPNGIAITRTGRVNAAGFVASTLDTTDEDFRAGRRQFRGSGASAKVTNHGSITIGRGGYAALIGGQVSNAGTISVPMGKVGLGSGERATLDLSGDGFLQVAVPTNAAGRGALVRSSGTISADGGSVILTAAAARDMARQAVNLSGTIEARSVAGRNGSITLSGSDGAVAVSGRLDATGKGKAGTGGAVTVTGRDIGLTQARIDVSGRAGGGSVRIGGGRQGGGPLPHAAEVRIDAATTIRADAARRGNGGDVVVWSDASTRFAGTISAKGGARGGDGGQAEVSSKGWLAYSGTTWLTARNGRFGTLLLDPYNVTISNGADTGGFTATGNDSVINATTLTNALASANVTVSTGSSGAQAGNITVAAPVAWSAPTTLTLNAANAIAVNSTISVQGGGGVALTYNAASPTNLSFARGASIDYGATDNGGTLSVNGQGYALVYSMAQLAAINASGRSALATDLTSITTYGGSVVPLGYSGTFEGLGHTISNLTISGGGPYLGLFGYTSGTIRDIGLVGGSVSGGDSAVVGALVGLLGQGSAPASVVNAWSSATVSGGNAATVGGLIGQTYASGGAPTLVANSYSTGAVTTGATIGRAAVAGGLVGTQTAPGDTATISGSYATGTVAGGSNASLGGLVGYNDSGNTLGTPRTASIVNSYATGSVGPSNAGVPTNTVGGLVGVNTTNAGISTISGSFATGAVSNGGTGSQGGNAAGGLVGANQANGTNGVASITDSFATGAATGQSAAKIGGLVGWNLGNGSGAVASIATSYATGRVSTTGYGGIGGLVGSNTVPLSGSATVASSFWDTSTSGTTTGIGGGDPRGQGGNVTGLTTAQLQGGSLPTGFGSGTWAAGAGLYPYLKATFANGVQAVSGFAYGDAGATALASGTNGAVRVSVLANGAAFGAATTGANGYYYAIGVTPIAAGQSVLAYTGADARTGATNAATVVSAGGTAAQGGVNLYGSTLAGQTSALTFSTLPDLRPAATAAAGGDAAALAAIGLASGRYYVATGSRFTFDQAVTIANTFGVQTTAPGAPITVAAPISIGSGASLGLNAAGALAVNAPVTASGASLALNAAGALAVNAPVTANGAVSVALGYDTSDAANLSFAIGAPLSFTGVGGALSINGNPYTLITDAAGLQAINAGPTGRYALAADIDASGISGFVPLGTSGAVATNGSNLLNSSKGFTGTFTGLGHTVDGLVVKAPQTQYVGLFGYVGTGGLVQNVGVTNADLRGVGSLGGIAGFNAGTVTQSYATGQVYATASGQANAPAAANSTGGLIGRNEGLLSNSFTTVTVNARDTNQAGGAVGTNYFATIDRVAATGAVDIGSGGSSAGGLVGYNYGVSFIAGSGVVTNSFATGAVSGGDRIGSFIGNNLSSSPVSGAYDATAGRAYTTFQPGSSGIGGGTTSGGSVSVVGLSTADLQNGGASGLSAAYGGGANGLYPYLKSFYPNGVQAISGIAYRNGATDVLSSSVGRPINVPDAGRVSVMANGKVLDTVSTGANGYYYVATPAGTLAANAPVLAYTVANASSGASNAATVVASTGGAALAGVTIYGSTLSGTVGDTVLSSAGPSLVAAANAAAGSNTAASNAIAGTAGRNFIATGAGFTIDQDVSTSGLFGVQTIAANAPITVAQKITVNGADTLQLQASGALALQASVSVPGAGKVALAASLDTTTAPGVSLLNLSFAPGKSIDYGATNRGGTLSINGQGYGLLYAMSDLAGINGSLGGRYALATDLDAGGTTYTSAVIAPGMPNTDTPFTGTLTGLGHAIANLAIANTADQMGVGLIGINSGTVRDLRLVGGTVSAAGAGTLVGALVGDNLGGTIANVASSVAVSGGGALYAGGLVGSSDGSARSVAIVNASATGSVLVSGGTAGGLVGLQQGNNGHTATIANSFATGQVTSATGPHGGLVGISQAVDGGTARIVDSFATGMVSAAGSFSQAGGLVGWNLGVRGGAVASLSNVYATGAVNGSNSGGLIGSNSASDSGVTTLTNAYWNTTTSGRQTGIGTDNASVSVTGLTTAQFQSGTLPAGFSSGLWSTGSGLYPYLASFFPNGVQVVTGTVYADAGLTAASPRAVGVVAGGRPFATVNSGADGSYYAFGQPGTITTGATLLVHNGTNGATLTTATGAALQGGADIYGNALTIPTTATSLSAAPTLSDARTTALAAAGGDAAATAAITSAGGRGFVASGAGFTIDQAVGGANTFLVRMTGASAGITVAQPITIASGGGLGLLATGALAVNAPITVNGAGTANLAYDASNPTNLTFAPGAPLTFANADGSAATGAVAGQALSINGQGYGLLYTMGDLDGVNGNLAGRYALARDLDASGHSYTSAVIAAGYANSDPAFTGILTGLGHAIANLSIANTTPSTSVGLIGNNSGTIRDLALIGGTVASNAGGTVTGALVGYNLGGTIANVSSSASVSGGIGVNSTGGLVGYSDGAARDVVIVNASSTGSVIVSDGYAGGLVGVQKGNNGHSARIVNSFATGRVSNANGQYAGGLVGLNQTLDGGTATIANSFATGAVDAAGQAGGLVGYNQSGRGGAVALLTEVYATGLVSGPNSGGLVGGNTAFGGGVTTLTNAYWNTTTSGRQTGLGTNDASVSVTGLTTAQLQSGTLPGGFSSGRWSTGSGLYPYLTSFFPNGIQVVTGTVYADAGVTPASPRTVGVIAGGTPFGSASSGADGSYYAFGQPGTIASGVALLVHNGANGATLTAATGAALQSGVDLYGNAVTVTTAANALSAAPSLADARASASASAGGDATALAAIAAARGRSFLVTGGDFAIDQAVSTGDTFRVQTTAANAAITVSNAITLADGASLGLLASGALRFNAPVTANGAVSVNLAYDPSALANLDFGAGRALTYTDAAGRATATDAGGRLTINGQSYTLLYSMADLDGIDGMAASANGINPQAAGTTGFYALANDLNAAGTPYADALVSKSLGVIEGLNHSITGLTIARSGSYAGLVGQNIGTLRDLALVGGSVSGDTAVGALAGGNAGGTVYNVVSSAAVTGNGSVGGLIGLMNGGRASRSAATGDVVGTGLSGPVGGLIGSLNGATVTHSYATGNVTLSGLFPVAVGGLIGASTGSSIAQVSAGGAVLSLVVGSAVGGLIGSSSGDAIDQATATGAVIASGSSSSVGGLIGVATALALTNGFYDAQTAGVASNGVGTALTTAQLKGALPGALDGAVWSTGSGLYPYLTAFFPDGVQAVSGLATKADGTPLASGASGLGLVTIASDGRVVGRVATGANGAYYSLVKAGTLASGNGVAAFTVANAGTGAADAITYAGGLPGTLTRLDLSGGWRRDGTGLTTLSALDAGFGATVAGTAAATLAPGSRAIEAAGAFALDTALAVADTLALNAAGAVTQSGLVTAPNLRVITPDAVTLTLAANRIGTVAANAARLDLANVGALTIGRVADATGSILSGVTTAGALKVATDGSLTIAVGAGARGADPMLAATGAFVNQGGPGAVSATSGRWLIYSGDPADGSFGGLDSRNTAVWNTAAGGAVSVGGDRYVFAKPRTLTVTSTDAGKVYGEDVSAALAGHSTVSGFAPGVAGAFLADTAATAFSGTALVTSAGAAATARVGAAPYAITVARGTLASETGYGFTFVDAGRLTLAARPITITAEAQGRLYGDADPALTYRIGGLGLVNGDTLGGGLATTATAASGIGAYAITQGSLAASPDYAVTYQGADLTVAARPITIAADTLSRIYGDANPALTYTVAGRGLANGDTLTGGLSTTATAASGIGLYAIAQGTLTASPNYAVTYRGAGLAVTARPITIAADALSRAYGDANPVLTYTLGGRGLANGDSLTGGLVTTAGATSGVGDYAVAQGTLAASPNYAVTYQGADLTVTARPITLTADAQSRVYGDANPVLTYAVGGRGLVNGDTLSGALATAADGTSDVGRHAITQGSLAASPNYAVTYRGADLTVTARPITLTADAQGRLYGDANPALTYTVAGRGLVNGDSLTGGLATMAGAASGVGDYAITQGSLAASSNYAITYQGATLTVTARPITVTADAQNRVYGDANPALTYTVGGRGLVNGDTLGELATAATTASGVGAYAITQGSLPTSSNYAVSYQGADLTVTARPITLSADAQSRVYGDANPALTYTLGGRGLVNGDTLSGALATSAMLASDAGTYAITRGSLAASDNYAVTYQGADMTVTARPITITANALSRVYGDANPPLTYTVGGRGLVNGDALAGALATSATLASDAGTYAITRGSLAASDNYAVTYQGADLTVTARPITITANALSRVYGDANPPLTYTVGGRGLVNGDTPVGGLATTATATSGVGRYTITQGSLAASGNYAVTYQDANLAVTARPITVTADALSRIYGDANPTLPYTVGGRGLVNGDVLSGALATGATLASDVGAYTITQGSLAASDNYAVTYQGARLAVTARPITITADAQSRVYGDANPALTYTVGGSGLVNGDTLSGGLDTTATAASGVGAYAIAQGSLAASPNYAVTYQGANLAVTARPITITADAQIRVYGAANPALTYTVGGRGLVNFDTLTGSLTTTADGTSPAGTYPIARGSLAASANYALTYDGALLTVTGAPAAPGGPAIDASTLASTVTRTLDEAGAPRGGGTGAPVPIADSEGGFASLTDPRFAGIVVCVGGSAGGCFPVPTAAAPPLQAAR